MRMKFRLKVFFLSFLFVSGASFSVADDLFSIPQRCETTTGTIREISLNLLIIDDENMNQRRRFVYLGTNNGLQPGDRVRIRYCGPEKIAERVDKLTVLEYKKEGQNLGYIEKIEE